VAWFARGAEHGPRWTRWIWIPIVLPALILAWLSWRAVAGERELYRIELIAAHQRFVTQLAGRANVKLEQELESIASHMQDWGAHSDSTWLDTSGIVLLGLRNEDGQERLLGGSTRVCGDIMVPHRGVIKSDLQTDSLEILHQEMISILHDPCAAWNRDTLEVLAMRKGLEPALSRAPQWRALMDELFDRAHVRIREADLWKHDSSEFHGLLAGRGRGMSLQRGSRFLVMILREPLVPKGIVVACILDEAHLAETVFMDLQSNETKTRSAWGWKSPFTAWKPLSGHPEEGEPMASARLTRGSGDWVVGVWPPMGEIRQAAKGRTVMLALVLAISVGILLFTAWATASAVDAQRQLLALKTDFVSNVTHELKTPLTSILMFAELLESGKALNRAQEFGGVIRKEAARLGALIEGILAVARQEAGMGRLDISQVDASRMVQELCSSLEPLAEGKGIRIDMRVQNHVMLNSDPAMLRSILQNLIDNAIKYGRSKGRVEVELRKLAHEVIIAVLDNGPGIPAEDQKRVFDRFFRGGSGLTRSISGTGLGLSIVRSAVETLGGKLKLESSSDWGTRVTVTIPDGSLKNG
jgi:signal transduction histidine kinase